MGNLQKETAPADLIQRWKNIAIAQIKTFTPVPPKSPCLTHSRNNEFCPEIEAERNQTVRERLKPLSSDTEKATPPLQAANPEDQGRSFYFSMASLRGFRSRQNKLCPADACTHAQLRVASRIYWLHFPSQGSPHNDFDKEM